MKKFSKILSSVLAASMIMSYCAINALAASTAHTVTISASKTTGIEAGDSVVITLTIDNTENLVGCGYKLNYSTTAFSVDTTKSGRNPENYIDKTWLNDIKDTEADWAYYLGNPSYSPTSTAAGVAGQISFAWAGQTGVESEYAVNDRVIGKFTFTANENATGDYTFSLDADSSTRDDGENSTAALTATPLTVSFASAAPAATITGVTISPTSATVNGGESQTFTATVSGTGDYDSTVTYSATAGTITSAGVFTAPAATDEAQTITVTATSNGDNTKSATATVTVPAAAPVVPTPTATVGTVQKGHDMYGQNTAVTKLSSIANALNPFVRITLGGDHKDYDLPAGVKGGSANIIAILRYAKGITGTFNIAVMDGDTVVASQDYEAN